jgi:hypothetical protein
MALYKLFMPKQAVGADLVYFDLFNVATGGYKLEVVSLLPIVSGAVAVTGVVGVDLLLTKTTAVGTGGTAATAEGSSTTAATFSAFDNEQTLDLTRVSARLTPSGGATAGAVIGWRSVFTEETSAGAYEPPFDFIRPDTALVVRPGTGIRVVQGAVASVGNIGFDITINLTQK